MGSPSHDFTCAACVFGPCVSRLSLGFGKRNELCFARHRGETSALPIFFRLIDPFHPRGHEIPPDIAWALQCLGTYSAGISRSVSLNSGTRAREAGNYSPRVFWTFITAKPIAASGLSVSAYAAGLDHPRWLYVLPNGDVLVAETNGPPRPEDGRGIRGWIYQLVQGWVGAGVPSANRITLLRNTDGDGVVQMRSIFLQDLNSPFGMALIGHDLYVANTDAVMRFNYADGDTVIRGPGVKVCDLPAGPLNHHWTKNLIAGLDGKHLYVAVGSNSNAAENGLDKEDRRASILEIDISNGQSRVFASGLRNPVGMAWEPDTGALWTVVNERDELGSDLVPDYLTSVKDGAFYGWPFSYYGQHLDDRVIPQRPDLVAKAVVPMVVCGEAPPCAFPILPSRALARVEKRVFTLYRERFRLCRSPRALNCAPIWRITFGPKRMDE
jgi:glucose/arabinose dehydrogenase